MSTREYAVSVLASLSEERMLEFIQLFADDNVLAKMESEFLLTNQNTKRYSSFKEFRDEVENEK